MSNPSKTHAAPWEVITWSPEHQQTIYRDWGINYSFKQQYSTASKYFSKSLDIKNDDLRAFLYRSYCKDGIAQCQGALDDALSALALDDLNQPANLQVCDAIYQMNEFEKNKLELSRKGRKFVWKPTKHHGVKLQPGEFHGHREDDFLKRLDVVDQNFKDTLGEHVGIFLTKHKNKLDEIVNEIKKRKTQDPRPLWKVLKDEGKCDIMSILEDKAVDLHVREKARLAQSYRVFLQVYFLKGWKDVAFLKDLITDKRFLLPQTKKSTPHLSDLAKNKYETVYTFLKMLHARSPLYTKRYKMCPDQKLATKIRQDYLYRIQYQTRRDMFNILENVKKLRAEGKTNKLAAYVEQSVGSYLEKKTLRIFPRKFEFVNEIYNTLALAYADRLVVPSDLMYNPANERLFILLGLPLDKDKQVEVVKPIFGERSTFQEPDAPNYKYMAYKKRTTRLEKRLNYAKFPIEKCYMYHELAKNHITQSKLDEARALGMKVLEEKQAPLDKMHHYSPFISQEIFIKIYRQSVSMRNPEDYDCDCKVRPLSSAALCSHRTIFNGRPNSTSTCDFVNVPIFVIPEGKLCNNYLWQFLGVLAVCKANLLQHKMQRFKLSLQLAAQVAEKLKSERITHFITTCIDMNQLCIGLRSDSLLFNNTKKGKFSLSASLGSFNTESSSIV